ncbi:DUF305 domain-containing protein [Mycobacterium sp. TNTM28]|uniref:DUF305 domain-containing protein n=1 Tax=[Mycobacterium] fortunisiensis TaxID=2600579 RepID=A0ABS6KSE4_9MYCO|nr:DUF305 domain-containing protein [[Mycobacterium] fortunisiensis]MBU9766191.1 DUF305 domain-containing protein [[Mycobacterium] fortunisiensis]
MSKLTMLSAGAAVAAVLVAGCGNETAEKSADVEVTTSSSAAASPSGPVEADQAAHNDADVMFAHHMIPHHQQAVEMSDVLLAKSGIDAQVTELATRIKDAQAPEIAQMQDWLRQWGNPPMPPMTPGGADHGGGHGDMPAMQGMVSEADMTALRNAEGAEAAKLYLTHMIAHHEGAIVMAKDEIHDGQYPAAIELARTIVNTQQQEIGQMRQILGTL